MESVSATTIVESIDDLLRLIWRQLDDPGGLSETILRLAVLNGGIGNYLAEAQDNERRSKNWYEHRVDTLKLQYVKEGESATVGESKAKLECQDLYNNYLDAQYRSNILKLKRQDTDQAIDAARSRLSLIKNDLRQVQ